MTPYGEQRVQRKKRMRLVLRDFFIINGTSKIARMRYFIYNLVILAILFSLPFLPELFNVEFSFNYFIFTMAFVVIFYFITINLCAKRFRDIGISTPYNLAIIYTFVDLLFTFKFNNFACDALSYAVMALICIIPSGYMNKSTD